MRLKISFLCVFPLLIWSLTIPKRATFQSKDKSLTYLALGDSYTIGESVEENERWPVVLTKALNEKGLAIEKPIIIAKTGWRTDEMLSAAKKQTGNKKYDVVSLLIGVNNEFQGRTPESFKSEFESCLNYAIATCNSGKKGVFVLSIPDYGFTPYGKKNQTKISKRLAEYNAICKELCSELKVNFYDITPLSTQGLKKPNYVANDGLHPSGAQYKAWVNEHLNEIFNQLKSNP